jgi:hypothetical protein
MVGSFIQDKPSLDKALDRVVKQTPFHYAPVTIVEGEQKSGKTCFCVTRVVDPTYAHLTAIKLYNGTPEGILVKAAPVLKPNGFAVIGLAKIWLPNSSPKIMPVPPRSILIAEGIRIFANFHLRGIRYKFMTVAEIIAHLNDGTITGISPDGKVIAAYLIIDEAYLAGLDKRRSLAPLAIVMSQLGYQIAKRHLNVMIALPDANVLGFRIINIESEHVVCTYDEFREEITARIQARKKYKQPRPITFNARKYFKYYDPDEQHQISNQEMARALESVS